MSRNEFVDNFNEAMNFVDNPFHPLVWMNGNPIIGKDVYVGGFSIINAKGANLIIGDGCDIASFVSINVADSHYKCIGLSKNIIRKDIVIENNVFIGSHSVILGGVHIGHHSVVGAGTVVSNSVIPPYSLVTGNPMTVKIGYYAPKLNKS